MSAAPPSVVPILATPFAVVPLAEVAALNGTLAAAFGARAGYLPKPFTAEMLLRYARQQLERSRSRTRTAAE